MKQNEIWLVNLDPTVGAEIKKTRPAIIVNDNGLGKLPLRVIVPITDWKAHYQIAPWMVKAPPSSQNGLTKPSSVDCFQIRSVSQSRLIKRIGIVEHDIAEKIKIALSKVLSIQL